MVERRGLQREAAAEGEIKDPPLKNGSSLIQAPAHKQKTAPLEPKGAAPGPRDDSARIVRVQPIGWARDDVLRATEGCRAEARRYVKGEKRKQVPRRPPETDSSE